MNDFCILLVTIMFVPFISGGLHCKVIPNTEEILTPGFVNLVYLSDLDCDFCTKEMEEIHDLLMALKRTDITIKLIVSGSTSYPLQFDEFKTDNNTFWDMFEKSKGHVLIFDRCGRFTYEVIRPWSSFSRIFVKAAITATYHDNPCQGLCPKLERQLEKEVQALTGVERKLENKIPIYPKIRAGEMNPNTLSIKGGEIPLRIVMRRPHKHEGENTIFEHIELRSDNKIYHSHIEEERDMGSEDIEENYDFYLITNYSAEVTTNSSENNEKYTEIPLDNQDYYNYKLEETQQTVISNATNHTTEKYNNIKTIEKSDNEAPTNVLNKKVNDLNKETEQFYKELAALLQIEELDQAEDSEAYDYDSLFKNTSDDLIEEIDGNSKEKEEINKLVLHYSKLVNRIFDNFY